MTIKKQLFILFKVTTAVTFLGVLFVLACNLWVVHSTSSRIYNSADDIANSKASSEATWPVGLVLGTSKKVAPDTPNQHFENRIKAAAELQSVGIVDHLLVSGHRDSKYYDETRDMIARLVELGVPQEKLIADDKGVRTFESVTRARNQFGVEKAVIVSDDFHVGRALFIADRIGLDAVALSSEPVDPVESRRVRMREYFARVKAVLDLYWLEPEEREGEVAGIVSRP